MYIIIIQGFQSFCYIKYKNLEIVPPQMCHLYWSNLSSHAWNPLERQKYLCTATALVAWTQATEVHSFNYLSLPSGTVTPRVLLGPTFVLFNVCLGEKKHLKGACAEIPKCIMKFLISKYKFKYTCSVILNYRVWENHHVAWWTTVLFSFKLEVLSFIPLQ